MEGKIMSKLLRIFWVFFLTLLLLILAQTVRAADGVKLINDAAVSSCALGTTGVWMDWIP